MSPDILILGASGFLGSRLYGRLGPERAFATYLHNEIQGAVRFDAARDDVGDILAAAGPVEHGIILFARSIIDACAHDPEAAASINVAATRTAIDRLNENGVMPVFASTDYVFDGAKGGYSEDDPTNPIVTYSRQKLEIEDYLQASGAPFLVARFPKLISSERGDGTLLSDWLDRIDRGEPIRCAEDQSFSIIDVVDAVEAMVALIDADATGVYHVGGPTDWRRAEFLAAFVAELRRFRDVDPDIRLCSIRDFEEFAEPRPFDTSLNSGKLARDVGFRARNATESCRRMAESLYSEVD